MSVTLSSAISHPCLPDTRAASLELTPVGGRLSIIALIAPNAPSQKVEDVGDLTEELDKLGFGEARAAGTIVRQGCLTTLTTRQGADGREKGLRGNEGEHIEAADERQWLFRVEQHQIADGQQALRLSMWHGPQTEGFSKGCRGAPNRQPQSAHNFYFRLPCTLPSLKLLGASYTSSQTAAAPTAANGHQQQVPLLNGIRLSLQCSLRPGSLSEALKDAEERALRAPSTFRLTCRRCGECISHLSDTQVLLLPSAIWTDARDVVACEECAPAPVFGSDFHPRPGRVCAGPEKIFLSSSDTRNLLRGPWRPWNDRTSHLQAAVSCTSCGRVLGSERHGTDVSGVLRTHAAARGASHGYPATKDATADYTRECSVEQVTGLTEDHQASAHPTANLRQSEGSVGGEVSLLKRRVALHPFVAGAWGSNLLTRHSDLAAFTEELRSYSRAAAALRFIVLPFFPPSGVESPWEIGRQAPPSCEPRREPESSPSQNSAGDPEARTEAWVKATRALELRILLRECFVATSGTRDAGSQGHMAMKVLLREVAKTESGKEKHRTPQLCSVDAGRMHLARVDLHLFEELLRLLRVAAAGSRNDDFGSSQRAAPPPGVSGFGDGSAVAFLPTL